MQESSYCLWVRWRRTTRVRTEYNNDFKKHQCVLLCPLENLTLIEKKRHIDDTIWVVAFFKKSHSAPELHVTVKKDTVDSTCVASVPLTYSVLVACFLCPDSDSYISRIVLSWQCLPASTGVVLSGGNNTLLQKKKHWSFTVKFEQVSHVYDKRENMDRVWNHQVAFIKSVLRINHMPIRTSEVLSVSINVPAGCLRKWFSGIGAGWHLQSSFCAEVQPKLIRGFSSGT